jgi:hypothetical protein
MSDIPNVAGLVRNVRDFIYLDIPKLYSLYSQIFEGLSDRIVEERINQAITGETQSAVLRGASAESQALEASRRTESIVLYDHMYNRLEHELESSLLNAADLDVSQMPQLLSNNPMVKVVGRSEIEDYERLQVFMERFNELGEIIAYSSLSNNPQHKEAVQSLKQQIANAPSNSQKKSLEARLKQLTDASQLAKDLGLSQDPILLSKLKTFSELFNPTGYEVMITPSNRPRVHYRGIIDRAWLRYSPESLRSMYGGQSETPWIMVGAITHSPSVSQNMDPQTTDEVFARTAQEREASPMILDAYRNMFRYARVFERMFLESDTEPEVVISPLAVYREFQIPARS